jgi:hypothetical protein
MSQTKQALASQTGSQAAFGPVSLLSPPQAGSKRNTMPATNNEARLALNIALPPSMEVLASGSLSAAKFRIAVGSYKPPSTAFATPWPEA